MQDTSGFVHYQDILDDVNHWFEAKLVIDGVGTFLESDGLFGVDTNAFLFQNTPKLGTAASAEITVSILNPDAEIPPMACLRPFVRPCNEAYPDEPYWLPQGVFYVDTREITQNDDGLDVITMHGYDAMLKAEQLYNGRITGDSIDILMVQEIAYQLGVDVDARTFTLMNSGYTVPFPTGYTYREVLGYIASMYAGGFVMSDVGELRLVTIYELPPETNYLIDQVGDAITFGGDRILV